jgi:hypothetical protein
MTKLLVPSGSRPLLPPSLRRTRLVVVALLVLFGLLGISSAQAALTINSFGVETSNALAGGHPDAGTTFSFKRTFGGGVTIAPAGGNPRELVVKLPQGFVGDPLATPRCPLATFEAEACPPSTQVGVGSVVAGGAHIGAEVTIPIAAYNLVPPPDAPAMFGLDVADAVVTPTLQLLKASVDASDNYAITLSLPEIQRPDAGTVLESSLTLWGVPASPSHDAQRYCGQPKGLSGEVSTGCSSTAPLRPLVDNPTDCGETPLTTLSVDTYQEPEVFSSALTSSPVPTECAQVPFGPSISLTPDTTQAGEPTGLSVGLTLPQNEAPESQGSADLEKAAVTLPQGMTISPSAASKRLEGCTNEQLGAGSDTPATCPASSVIGEDEVQTSLLEGPLKGNVYLGQPLGTDPTSGQMFRIFLELQGFGLDIKLQGSVVANPQTGQLTTTFSNLPALPFQNFRLHFDDGPNAVLVNPPTCGPHTTTTQLFPYSNPRSPATPPSTFNTSYNGTGAACPTPLPFSPSASVSTASAQAGAASSLSVTFARADGTQALGQIDAKLPQGLLGYVSRVPLCEATVAIAGGCSAESRIGTVSTSAGAGSDPLTVQGSVYLARGSNGYPFMLSVVVPAVAGPYNLGNVVVPVWLQVNSDGSITAVSGPLPSILDGIPLDIRSVTTTLDRPGFTVNPTDCAPLSLTGTATSLSGTAAVLSAPFSVGGCASLPFAPSFTVASQGATSKANGASLTVRVSQEAGESAIHSVHVELPKSLPARNTTLNKACTEQQFAANPAGCPPGSFVGTATAYTPLLPVPVAGPAILVSHAAAAFPDLDLVLQGDGITIDLVGNTDIKHGITSSTFASVPDVPISGFELQLPEGPYSIFTATGNLCEQKLLMPTTIAGQNGRVVQQPTRIAVTGCAPTKPTVKVVKTKAKASRLVVSLKTSATGTVKLSGAGLETKTKKNVRAGTSQIEVSLTRTGKTMLVHHEKLKLRASLTAGKIAVAKTTSVKL